MTGEDEMFGPYRVGALLGRGGMGEVHRAYDTVHDREIALKRLSTAGGVDTEFQARFRREARIVARLNEPHVIPVHAYGEIDGRLYLDMRVVDGTDLRKVLGDGPIRPRRALAILGQVASALDAAHEAGLVHRDIKPSNILLDANEFAYLTDFGIATSASPEATSMTQSGHFIGTMDYLAPERLRSGPVDGRADVYSLACVLYECLVGQTPYGKREPAAVIAAHLAGEPPAPSRADGTLPRAIDDVVATGMAVDPDRRYPTASAFIAAARAALDEASSQPTAVQTPAAPPPAVQAPVAERRSRGPLAAVAAAVLLVAGLITAIALLPGPTTSGVAVAGPNVQPSQASAGGPAGTAQSNDDCTGRDGGEQVRVGVKMDAPGIGLQTADGPKGFDVDVACFLARQAYGNDVRVEWVEVRAGDRESMITGGQVDFVVATYTITDGRKEVVDFAGPYYVAGQSLLVRAGDDAIGGPDDLKPDTRVCTVTGSTAGQQLGTSVDLVELTGFTECVQALGSGEVDAVTGDDLILAGYGSQRPGEFALTGQPLSEEPYGVGLRKGQPDLKLKLAEGIERMVFERKWHAALADNFAGVDLAVPSPPTVTER